MFGDQKGNLMGIYGMNFRNLPKLNQTCWYYLVLVAMVAFCLIICMAVKKLNLL